MSQPHLKIVFRMKYEHKKGPQTHSDNKRMQETLISANRHLINASAPLLLSTNSTTHVHYRWTDALYWLLPNSHAFPTTFTYDSA